MSTLLDLQERKRLLSTALIELTAKELTKFTADTGLLVDDVSFEFQSIHRKTGGIDDCILVGVRVSVII